MAVPAIATASLSAGFIAADVTPSTYGTTNTVLISVAGAVFVALIGAGVQIWNNRSKNRNAEPQLTPETRLALVEQNQADMKGDLDRMGERLDEIDHHLRPWRER